jgi:serine/threonine protein kinase
MGRVYVGEQISPARQVAVKVVQLGMATEATRRRFEQEAAIHSRLDHPAITQCFAVGTYESSLGPVPFAVMELVRGAKPITVHAREHSLPLDERLRLFKLACEGVAHGHERGVVHRDLKPGNILVGDDGHPHHDVQAGPRRDSDRPLCQPYGLGGGTVVLKDVIEPGDYMGHPLLEKRRFLRLLRVLRGLVPGRGDGE